MTIWWCQGCGREDTFTQQACPTCGSAMQVSSLRWLMPGNHGGETHYELDLSVEERSAIVHALVVDEIAHRWEGPSDLIVMQDDEPAVDHLLDEILGPEDLGEDDDEGPTIGIDDTNDEETDDMAFDDGDPDEGYELISRLYGAVDRIYRKRDVEDVRRFVQVATLSMSAPLPFGVDEETWADILSSARNTSAALDVDAGAPVESELVGLRNQLQQLV